MTVPFITDPTNLTKVPENYEVFGGRPDIPAGTGIEGAGGSEYLETHYPVPGLSSYRDSSGPSDIGLWVDATTGLLRFDRLPLGAILVGRYQNSKGTQFNAYNVSQTIGTTAQPPVTTTTPSPTPAGPTIQQTAAVNLSDLVKISAVTIDRQYIKGTLRQIDKETITFTNTSQEFNITVTIQDLGGVKFTPSTFELLKNSIQPVEITFDSTIIDKYPDGVSAVNCVVTLSSKDAVITQPAPLPPPPPVVVVPPVIVPPQPVPESPSIGITPSTTYWTEKRYSRRNNAQSLNTALLASSPADIRQLTSINYAAGIPEKTFINWTKKFRWNAGELYRFTGRTDDGIRIYINNQLIYNGWREQSVTPFQATYTAPTTGEYTMLIEYFNNNNSGICTVSVQYIPMEETPTDPVPVPLPPVNEPVPQPFPTPTPIIPAPQPPPVFVPPTIVTPQAPNNGGGGSNNQDNSTLF